MYPGFTPANPPTNKQSLVYVYRLKSEPYNHDAEVEYNSKKVSTLPTLSYSYLYINPGKQKIKTKYYFKENGIKEIEFEAKAGQTYYFKQDATYKVKAFGSEAVNRLTLVTRENALKEILPCKKIVKETM